MRVKEGESLAFCSPDTSYQGFIGESLLLGNLAHHIGENQINGVVAVVVTVGKFVNIPLKMLFAHQVVYPMIPTFEQSPKTFGPIGMDISRADILASSMTDNFMGVELAEATVGQEIIGIDIRPEFYIINYLAFKRHATHIFNNLSLHVAAALKKPHDGGFGEGISSLRSLRAFGTVFVFFLAPYIGFVHFNGSKQLAVVLLQGVADSMIHKPCRFLCNAYLFGKLNGRNTLLVDGQEIDGNEPFLKWYFAFPKNRPRYYPKILFAFSATVSHTIFKAVDFTMSAMRTIGSVAKTEGLKILPARFFILEKFKEVCESFEVHIHV